VTKVENIAEIASAAGTTTATVGMPIHAADELRTQDDARLQVTFDDGTVLTLGANASVTVNAYVYAPDRDAGEALLRTTRGAFRFVTGKIGKLKAKSVVVSTPVATIGVRGTEFWGGPIDEKYGVLLFEGKVEVANAAGSVTLAARGQGTNILSDAEPPSEPKAWSEEKVARALATVALR
jgi:hypothetical protein